MMMQWLRDDLSFSLWDFDVLVASTVHMKFNSSCTVENNAVLVSIRIKLQNRIMHSIFDAPELSLVTKA